MTSGGRGMLVENTDKLLWVSEKMIGGKTGYTRQARHCFVGALGTEHGPVILAVLGASSRTRLWQSAEILFELGLEPQGPSASKSVYTGKAKPKKETIRLARKN